MHLNARAEFSLRVRNKRKPSWMIWEIQERFGTVRKIFLEIRKKRSYKMQGIDMTEQLGLDRFSEARELKFGPSLTSSSSKFHTVKYDFKPASVDSSKVGKVDVGSDNSVTVTVPNLDGAETSHCVFKGSQRPYNKEYVLIIDQATGEITLERLSANIQVKKTREEPKRNVNATSMPVDIKKSPPPSRTNGRTKVISGKKREPSVQLHPKQNSPQQASPHDKRSVTSMPINSYSPAQPSSQPSTLASLPMIGSDNDDFALSTPIMPTSSSTQFSNTSMLLTAPNTKSSTLESDSSSSSSTSDSSSSDSEADNVPVPTINVSGNLNGTNASPSLSMPDNLLNDDLQLSESESDSD